MAIKKPAPPVGIIGIGIMGLAFAQNLRNAGSDVIGFDVSSEAARRLAHIGGMPVGSPREVANMCDVVLVALASVPAFDQALLGKDGLLYGLREGRVVCDMGTLPLAAKENAKAVLESRGVDFLDCPVSGTGAQAAKKDLVVYASGNEAAVERVRPVFDRFVREVRFVGSFGAGIKLKYIANLLVTIHNLAAAEALLLARKSGLDLNLVLDAVCAGAGYSRMLEVRGPMMIEGAYEPATMKMDVYMKDLKLILEHANDLRCPIPLMSASLPFYVAALAKGRHAEDTASLFAVLEEMSQPRDANGPSLSQKQEAK